MCGFAGFVSFGPSRLGSGERHAILQRMGRLLAHRGPDDQSIYDDDLLSLVYRRLSIVDLPGGRQPIFSEDGKRFIAVNGEIYNHAELRRQLQDRHQFSTHSDSEVPLHLFEDLGAEALQKLRGMFALAIWNRAEKSLFLARDRLGIKPLYICRLRNGLLFGSELKALLAHPECPRALNWNDLLIQTPRALQPIPTYVHGVEHLPGGHHLTAVDGRVEVRQWWNIDDHLNTAPFGSDAARYQVEFENLVDHAAAEHLLGDVPIGLDLSGGADSSLLAALVAERSRDVACFSVVDRNTFLAGDVDSARAVTAQLGLPWYPVLFDQRTLIDDMQFDLSRFEQSVSMMDSPRFDLEWIFKEELHRFTRRQYPSLKVVLLGQGLDEFAGGYSRRLDQPHASWRDYLNDEVEGELRFWEGVEAGLPDRYRDYGRAVGGATLAPYHQRMRLFAQALQHFQLWHEDRTSSSQSLEARVPYLDHRLVELFASVPGDLHAQLFFNKAIVREALAKKLPAYKRDHPKVQFFISNDMRSLNVVLHEALRRCLPRFLERYLDDPSLPFAASALRRSAEQVLRRQGNFYAEGWRLAESMAIVVFAAQLRTPDASDYTAVRRRDFAPPLIRQEQWPEITKSLENVAPGSPTPWSAHDRLARVEGAQVLISIDNESSYRLANETGVYSSITIPRHMEWIGRMLRHLASPQATQFTLSEWADEFDVELGTLIGSVETLRLAGFVERVPANAQ